MQTHNVTKIKTSIGTFSRKYTCIDVVGRTIGCGATSYNSVKMIRVNGKLTLPN
jgi:hypothetical protein